MDSFMSWTQTAMQTAKSCGATNDFLHRLIIFGHFLFKKKEPDQFDSDSILYFTNF